MRALVPLAAPLLAAAAVLTGCGGGGDDGGPKGNPFAGTWRSGAGAAAGSGGTTLKVDAKGALTFKSSLDCKGTVTGASPYRFAIDCGSSKFAGTASAPPKSGAFTITWSDGDSSEYRAA